MFAFAPMIGTRKLTKAGMVLASLFCAGAAPGSALDAQGAPQQDAFHTQTRLGGFRLVETAR